MNQNYHHYGLPSHYQAPVSNGYGTMLTSTPPYDDAAYATSHSTYSAPPQSLRTMAAYPSFASYSQIHTVSNGGSVQGSPAARCSSFTDTQPSNALFPCNPAVAARNRATSDAGNSALVPYTGQPSRSSTGTTRPNRASSPRQRASRNRAPSNASTSSCSTCSSTPSIRSSTRARTSTEVIHIAAGGMNVYIIYHRL
ncbi:hypothetical protein ARMGADRAFT_1077577 [Armillaria gallica]|uniref:Uncharacterized protein n=1 Tax=Armillaria gallica TaxID=47427 RepID=A0A2H3DQB0_ARMGA|nr:hypothetical protein ARMGADRAFT_1077577 [Armillaria gallica]